MSDLPFLGKISHLAIYLQDRHPKIIRLYQSAQ